MRSLLACSALCLCLSQAAPAQSADRVSFAGTVLGIERLGEPELPRVRITVRLTAPRIAAGQVVAFEEWDGLWRHNYRYRVGQTVALTLYPASALGLTSEAAARSPAADSARRDRARAPREDTRPSLGNARAPQVE